MDERSLRVLGDLALDPFVPLPLLRGGWRQTIAGVYWPKKPPLTPDAVHAVDLPDGDRLLVMENVPPDWRPGSRLIVLVHGLTGSFLSVDMVRLCRRFVEAGHRVFRVNLRNCGPSMGLSRMPYHSGRSEDTREVLRWLARQFPDSPVTQLGISLGGNITLKMAGEAVAEPTGNLDSVIAVSPPVDLAKSSVHMQQPRNRMFDRYFTRRLRQQVNDLHAAIPDLGPVEFPIKISLKNFDDFYTAPRSGFADAADYYARTSSKPLLGQISIPTFILSALDDPIVATESLVDVPESPVLDILISDAGGHVGFVGATPIRGDYRWMDHAVMRWLHARFPDSAAPPPTPSATSTRQKRATSVRRPRRDTTRRTVIGPSEPTEPTSKS